MRPARALSCNFLVLLNATLNAHRFSILEVKRCLCARFQPHLVFASAVGRILSRFAYCGWLLAGTSLSDGIPTCMYAQSEGFI